MCVSEEIISITRQRILTQIYSDLLAVTTNRKRADSSKTSFILYMRRGHVFHGPPIFNEAYETNKTRNTGDWRNINLVSFYYVLIKYWKQWKKLSSII